MYYMDLFMNKKDENNVYFMAQSAGVAEWTDWISTKLDSSKNCPRYGIKWSGEASVMLGLWGIQGTRLLSSLPGPLWPGVVALDGVLFMG